MDCTIGTIPLLSSVPTAIHMSNLVHRERRRQGRRATSLATTTATRISAASISSTTDTVLSTTRRAATRTYPRTTVRGAAARRRGHITSVARGLQGDMEATRGRWRHLAEQRRPTLEDRRRLERDIRITRWDRTESENRRTALDHRARQAHHTGYDTIRCSRNFFEGAAPS